MLYILVLILLFNVNFYIVLYYKSTIFLFSIMLHNTFFRIELDIIKAKTILGASFLLCMEPNGCLINISLYINQCNGVYARRIEDWK